MLGQRRDGLVDELSEMTFPIQVVGPRRRVFELERAISLVGGATKGLEEHQRIARAIPELVLREVRRDRVHPRRELLGAVEAVQVAIDANEDFLHEIFGAFAIADRSIDEVQKPSLVALNELLKGSFVSREKRLHHAAVVESFEPLSWTWQNRCLSRTRNFDHGVSASLHGEGLSYQLEARM